MCSIFLTRCWHASISCQPDGRPPQPVGPWKSGSVHLAEGSNVPGSCFRITVFYGVRAWSCCHLANEIKHVPGYSPMSSVFKNYMARGSQGFVGQSSPNVSKEGYLYNGAENDCVHD